MKSFNMNPNRLKIARRLTLTVIGLLALSTVFAAEGASQEAPEGPYNYFWVFAGMTGVLLLVIIALGNAITSLASNKKLWKDHFKNKAPLILLPLFIASPAMASDGGGEIWTTPQIYYGDTMFWTFAMIDIFLLWAVYFLLGEFKGLLKELKGEEEVEEVVEEKSAFSDLTHMLTDAIPLEREEEVMMDHEYDGIRELDNNLPPWWVYGFYLTIIFAFVYILHYHVLDTGDLSAAEYKKEMVEADRQIAEWKARQKNLINESNVVLLSDESALTEGKKIFINNCATCHKESGAGDAGPNLTDPYWIHGGGIKNVFTTVKYGVKGKSMKAWEKDLEAYEIQMVSSYILSLQGTEPEGGLPPEGELWTPEPEEEAEEAAEDGAGEKEAEEEVNSEEDPGQN